MVVYMYVNTRTLKCTFIHVLLYVQHRKICLLCIYCHNNCPYKAYHDVFSLRWWRFSNPKLTHDKHLCLVLLTNLSRCYDWLTLRLYNYYTLCIEDIRITILCLCMNMLICRKKKSSRVFVEVAIVVCVFTSTVIRWRNQTIINEASHIVLPSNDLKYCKLNVIKRRIIMYFTSMRGVRNIFIWSPTVNRSLAPIERIIILKWFLTILFCAVKEIHLAQNGDY
jgi:hypothetical protein